MADGQVTCEKSKLSDTRRLSARYIAEYPVLRWLTMSEVLSEESERRERIEADIKARPGDSNRARADRMHRDLGLSKERARKVVSAVVHSLEDAA